MPNVVDAQIVADNKGSAAVKAFARDLRDVKTAAQEAAQGGGFFQKAFEFATGGAIVNAVGGIISKFGELKDGMIGGNAEFEQYNTRFKVLLGSAEAAKQRMAELADFGQKTPFDLPQVVKADTIIQGFGLHSAEAAQKFGFSGEQIRTIAGDVASGTGASFEEMATLIGKFSSGATGEAISRMQELGITNRAELTKMGLQFSKAGELTSPLPQAMNVVLAQMQKKYGGLMDAQSATFEGMTSNLQDWIAGTMRDLGQPIFDHAKTGLQNLLTFLSSDAAKGLIESTKSIISNLINLGDSVVSSVVTPIVAAFQTLQPHLVGIIGLFQDFSTWINTGFQVDGITGAIAYFSGWLEQLIGKVAQAADSVFPGAGAAITTFGVVVKTVLDTLNPLIALFISVPGIIQSNIAMYGGFEGVLQSVADIFYGLGDSAGPLLNSIIPGLGTAFFNFVEQVTPTIEQVHAFATLIESNLQPILVGLAAGILTLVVPAVWAWVTAQYAAITASIALAAAQAAAFAPVIILFAAVAVAAGALYLAWQNNFLGIQDITMSALATVQGLIQTGLAFVQAWWQAHGDQVIATVQGLWATVSGAFMAAFTAISGLVQQGLGFLASWWDQHGQSVMIVVQTLWGTVSSLFTSGLARLQAIISTVLSVVQALWAAHGDQVIAVVSFLWEQVKVLFSGALSIIQTILTTAFAVLGSVFDAWAAAFQGDWRGFGENMRKAWDTLWAGIQTVMDTALDTLIKLLVNAAVGFVSAARTVVSGIQGVFTKTDWGALGAAIIDGIKAGISAGIKSLESMAAQAAQAALDAAKGALGIKSPSKEFYDIGVNTMNAWGLGITQSADQVLTAVAGVGNNAVQAASASIANLGNLGSIGGPVTPVAGGGILIDPARIFGNMNGGGVIGSGAPGSVMSLNGGGALNPVPVIGGNGSVLAIADLGNAGTIGGIDMSTVANLNGSGALNAIPVIGGDGRIMALAVDQGTIGTLGGIDMSTVAALGKGGVIGGVDMTTVADLGKGGVIGDDSLAVRGGQWAKYAANPANQPVQIMIGRGPGMTTSVDPDRMDIDRTNAIMAGSGAMNLPQEVDQHKENVVEGGARIAQYLSEGLEKGFGSTGLLYKLLAMLADEFDKQHAQTNGGGA